MFIDKINNLPDNRLEIIKRIKTSGKKLYLYGAGTRAVMLTDFLKNYDIDIYAYCVDDMYYISGQTLYGKPVLKFSDCCADDSVFLIAFQNYERASEIISQNKKVAMFYIDDPYDFYKMDFEYILRNEKKFSESYEMMSDELSQNVFVSFINGKISDSPQMLCSLRDKNGYQYDYDLLALGEDEVIVDCGAYTGDTINDIMKYTYGKCRKIIAFEPDKKNCDTLMQSAFMDNITVINKGVWDKKDVLRFHSSKSTASSFNEYADGNMTEFISDEKNYIEVPVTSIDDEINEDVTFIKMDIEGSELKALQGASRTIKRCYPKLAICVYHRVDDFITIPQYINSLCSEDVKYKFYMRHHAAWMAETVLYAIPEKKRED